jgi:putative acetyltransferase
MLVIRKMEFSDASRVAEIHTFGWRCAYRSIVSDDYLFNTLSVVTRVEKFEQELNEKEKESYVYDDGIVKAFLTVGPCRDEDRLDQFELWGIYVDPCFKGQGIGTELMRFCIKLAAKRGYLDVSLWVFENNVPSRRFYEKHRFHADGTRMYVESCKAYGVRYILSFAFKHHSSCHT